MDTTIDGRARPTHFEHEALIYHGVDELLAGTVPFLRAGLDAGDPMLVALPRPHLHALRGELERDAEPITFLDMYEVGTNPARIIPVWAQFLRQCAPGTLPRGIGEPVWAGRSDDELAECEHHEGLLNVAFDTSPPWLLLCPYDAAVLPPEALDAASRTHPVLASSDGARARSQGWTGVAALAEPNRRPLPPIPLDAATLVFSAEELRQVRRLVLHVATTGRLSSARAQDLALAAHELAANSILHGGGSGVVRAWVEGDTTLVEVRDPGEIDDPLVGRRQPSPDRAGGRGVWMANQLCDLVQVRRLPTGTAVRLHQRAPGRAAPR